MEVTYKNNKPLTVILIILVIICALLNGVFNYLLDYSRAVNVETYFKDSQNVEVSQISDYFFFDNKNNTSKALIFYPGAKVDEKAYAPICRGVAEQGYDVFLMAMPFHMAIFNKNCADKIYNNYHYSSYYLGGHSMGGMVTGMYLSSTQNSCEGIILLGAYITHDLTGISNLKTLSLYGTNDGVLNRDNYANNKKNLPNLTEHIIDGGNHAQFGSYGKQSGDNDASITLEEQTSISVSYISSFMK